MPSRRGNMGGWTPEDLEIDVERDAREQGIRRIREAGSADLRPLSDTLAAGDTNYVGILDWHQADAGPTSLRTLVISVYDTAKPQGDTSDLPEMRAKITFGTSEGDTSVLFCDVIGGTVMALPARYIRVEVTKVKTFSGAEIFTATPRATALVADGAMTGQAPQLTLLSQEGSLAPAGSVVVDVPPFAKNLQLTTDTPGNNYQIQQMNVSAALAFQDWTLGANQLCPEIGLVGLARKIKVTNQGLIATTHGPWLIFGLGV